jgi:hypothetical protein
MLTFADAAAPAVATDDGAAAAEPIDAATIEGRASNCMTTASGTLQSVPLYVRSMSVLTNRLTSPVMVTHSPLFRAL